MVGYSDSERRIVEKCYVSVGAGKTEDVGSVQVTNSGEKEKACCVFCRKMLPTKYRILAHVTGDHSGAVPCGSVPLKIIREFADAGNAACTKALKSIPEEAALLATKETYQVTLTNTVFTKERTDASDVLLFRAFVRNGIPLHVADNLTFREFLSSLAKGYNPASSFTLGGRILEAEHAALNKAQEEKLGTAAGGSIESDGAFNSNVAYVYSGPLMTTTIDSVDYDDTTKDAAFVADELSKRIDATQRKAPVDGCCLDNTAAHVGSQESRGTGFEKHGALGLLQEKLEFFLSRHGVGVRRDRCRGVGVFLSRHAHCMLVFLLF